MHRRVYKREELRGPSTPFTEEEAMQKTRQVQEGGESWWVQAGSDKRGKDYYIFACCQRQRMYFFFLSGFKVH